MMLLSIAWRNVLRARRRTAITLTLSTISTAFFIFYVSMMDGSYAKIFKDSVEIYPGYIQITQKEYRNDPGYEHLIFDAKSVETAIENTPGIALYAERFEGFALYASDENSIGGMFAGINPEKEKQLSRVYKAMKEGEYLSPDDTNRLLIGSDFAKRLGVGIGDTVSIITNATDYSFAADNLIVKGIFQTHLNDFDASAAFVNKAYFDRVMLSKNIATHIVILPTDLKASESVAEAIGKKLDNSEYEVQDWHRYMKEIIEAMEFDRYNGIIMMWLFLVIILFVIMIYALLTIFARTKEIGIMRAIGTTPFQIFYILMLETLLLGLISVILGGIIGGWLAYYFELNPIRMESFEEAYRQYGIVEAVLPTDFSWGVVFRGMAYMIVLNILCALYPILHVNRFKPVDAIRHI